MRVRAAAINIGNWHVLRGIPYAMRPAVGLFKPKHEIPGLDLAGQVEAVGGSVKQFQPGDEVFGWCNGAFAEYACAEENNPAGKAVQPHAGAGCGGRRLGLHRPQRGSGPGRGPAGTEGRDQRRVGRRWHVRHPDREVVRGGRDGRVRTKNVEMVRSIGANRVIMHEGRLRSSGPALRRDARLGREPFAFGLHGDAEPPGDLCLGRRVGHGPLVRSRSPDQGALAVTVRAPERARVHRQAQPSGPGCSQKARRGRRSHAGHRQALPLA